MIRLIKPYITFGEVEDQIREVFDSGMLTKGYWSKEFPRRVAEYLGASHAFLTTSATTALSMALHLVDVGPGDEVIVSDFSFPATSNVVEDLGATTVFADVSLDTFNMLPEQLEEKITPKTKAVMFVDALGNPSGIDEILEICHSHGIPLIEDAACGIGSKINGRRIGTVSDITCFSLHPRKLLTCGEGGIITTENDTYAEMLAIKLNHGADPKTGEFVTYGYNYRMAEIPCLMGCNQIGKIDAIVEQRREQRDRYAKLLEPLGFVAQKAAPNAYHNMQSVVFKVPEGMDRDALHDFLAKREIESTIGTYCLSGCAYYREKYNDVQENAKFLQDHTITLPCYEDVPVEEVCDAIAEFAK
ncbi:MAG: DegT/DnrJ/EryC1/StrS family aminotransferase [Coriobacteriales bacterium]|jgi:perosamine synthetase